MLLHVHKTVKRYLLPLILRIWECCLLHYFACPSEVACKDIVRMQLSKQFLNEHKTQLGLNSKLQCRELHVLGF